MTTQYCPTCHQAVPDRPPLPLRVRAALAAAGHPLTPKQLRRLTETTEAVMYQTLRRMRDRGEVRKVDGPDGQGYILVGQRGDTSRPLLTPEAREQLGRLDQLTITVEELGGMNRDGAERFLVSLGESEEAAEELIRAGIKRGHFTESEGRIFA